MGSTSHGRRQQQAAMQGSSDGPQSLDGEGKPAPVHRISPAEPRPGHPGQLAGLPRYSRGGRGEGGAYAGSPAGARRTKARA